MMLGLLKLQIELTKDKYPEIHKQMLMMYAQTTKWAREITEDEARAIIEWSWKEIAKADKDNKPEVVVND